MTDDQEKAYEDTDALREVLNQLKGRKFRFDCGITSLSGTTSETRSPSIATTRNPRLFVHNAGIRSG